MTTAVTTYSSTEKKRIRKSFAKRASVLNVPFLLATQLESYTAFLQAAVAGEKRKNEGLQAAFTSIFRSPATRATPAGVRQLPARRAAVRREGVPAARADLREPAARQGSPHDHGQGGLQADGQGSEGAGSVHGGDSAHDDDRLVMNTPSAERCSWLTITPPGPCSYEPVVVMSGISPMYTSCSFTSLTVGLEASLSMIVRRTLARSGLA